MRQVLAFLDDFVNSKVSEHLALCYVDTATGGGPGKCPFTTLPDWLQQDRAGNLKPLIYVQSDTITDKRLDQARLPRAPIAHRRLQHTGRHGA